MRKLAPFLLIAAVLSFAPFVPAPVGPGEALAVDDPAFYDGGTRVVFADAGTTITIDTFITGAWNMAITCRGQAVCYRMCEASSGSDPATCSANRAECSGWLKQDTTFDIPVPSNRRYLSLTSDDAGTTINCSVARVTP